MPDTLTSLDEASWRLERSGISGRTFGELHDRIDLSRVTSFRAEPGNVVVAGGVKWTDIKLSWRDLCAALKSRGRPVSWSWPSDITPEMLQRARRPDPARRLLGDPRPPVHLRRAALAVPQSSRRARLEWFEGAGLTGAIPASGSAPLGKRGPKSGKRENTAAGMRKDVQDEMFTVNALRAMPEKELADRYGVSRDTARKARNDVLQSRVEISTSTND